MIAFAKQSGRDRQRDRQRDRVGRRRDEDRHGELAGAITIEATATGLTTGTLGAFKVVHGAATEIVLTGSTADLTSGATRLLTATIVDASGNTVTSDNSTAVAFAKASGAGTVSGWGMRPRPTGIATKTITGPLAGSVTMEATSVGLTTGTLGAFSVVHGAAAQITLGGSTADLDVRCNARPDGDDPGRRREHGHRPTPPHGDRIRARQSGAGTVSGTGSATAASGVATKTITGQLVGSVTMEADVGRADDRHARPFKVVHGAAAQIALSGATTSLTAGATRVLTATLRDAAGNTVISDNSTVIAFAKQSGTGTVGGTGNATASGGDRDEDDHRRPRRLASRWKQPRQVSRPPRSAHSPSCTALRP